MPKQNYQNHLHILSKEEIKQLYSRPTLGPEERDYCFRLSEAETLAMGSVRGIDSKVLFLLQLGYFKAKHQFFVFELSTVEDDVSYLLRSYFPEVQYEKISLSSKPTRLSQQKLICKMTGFRPCKGAAKVALFNKALELTSIHCDPVFIFRSLLHYLEIRKIILPAYSFIQRHIISKAIQTEQARLEQLLATLLDIEDKALLDQLLETYQVGKVSFYLLTYLQQEPSSFAYQQMKRQVERKDWIASFYKG